MARGERSLKSSTRPPCAIGRMLVGALLVVATLLTGGESQAAGYIYRWVDKAGVLHITDRLGDVPEPYYAAYKKLLDELEKNNPKGETATEGGEIPLPPEPPARAPDLAPRATAEAARRASWKQLVAHWRAVLTHAVADLSRAEELVGEARANPLLAETPEGRQRTLEADAQLDTARRLEREARTMLLETLPAQARREHVPPAWLD